MRVLNKLENDNKNQHTMKITKEEKLRILKLHESYRGWNGSLIKEQIQYGRELRWYEDEEGRDDFGVGEIFNSDICGEGLADSVWDVMELLWEATDYFNPAQFSNWDENKIVKAFQSAQAKDIGDINSVLYCYLNGISKLGKWKMDDNGSGIATLMDIAFQGHEEDEKQKILDHLKKIDPKFRVGPEMDGRDDTYGEVNEDEELPTVRKRERDMLRRKPSAKTRFNAGLGKSL